jgi:tetratricopeptide (TPR) repeat protein
MQAPDQWQLRLEAEAARLGEVLCDAFAVDAQTIGSPVYKEVVGLRPADWSDIKTAKAKYFGEVFTDWKARVDVARLNGWPGDILTLADDAPTRFHRVELLWHAVDALCSMNRFEAALQVAQELLVLEPKHQNALTRLGLILARLGRTAQARVHMLQVVADFQSDAEAHGILAHVYKDLWRLEWQHLNTLSERQTQAVATSGYIVSAVRIYNEAARQKFDFWNGISVVSFMKLLKFLKAVTKEEPVATSINDIEMLGAMVRFAATNTLNGMGQNSGQKSVWAAATLGELELVLGNQEKALAYYRTAALAPETTWFNVNSMLDQVRIFDSLGFRQETVAVVKKLLEDRCDALEKKFGWSKTLASRFANVFVASGHMIDKQTRDTERFPASKEANVKNAIEAQLTAWNIGPTDLAICGGACGADILFAELAVGHGAEVWLMLPLPEAAFLDKSIRMRPGDWEQRYYLLKKNPQVTIIEQQARLKAPPKGHTVYVRNNMWMINTARVEIRDTANLFAIIVWDESPTGDGPGGTSDFNRRIRELGGRRKIINPTAL